MRKYTYNDPFYFTLEKIASTKSASFLRKALEKLLSNDKARIAATLAAPSVMIEGTDRALGGSGVLSDFIMGKTHNPNWVERKGYDLGAGLGVLSLLPDALAADLSGNREKIKEISDAITAVNKAHEDVRSKWRPLYS